MKKIIVSMILFNILLFSSVVYANNISNGIISREILVESIDEVDNYKIDGNIPQIINIRGARFVDNINEKIRESYLFFIRGGYRHIKSEYEVYNWANITSIVIKYRLNSEREVVRTFVFDNISQSEVTLRNLLGKDFMEYTNKYISDRIDRSAVGVYYLGTNRFQSIRANQNFYLKDGEIIILFDQGSIAPAETGIPEFSMPLESLSITLSQGSYTEKNGTIFIPVSAILRFGMDIRLREGGVLEISSHQQEFKKTINVHNDMLDKSEVIYINGYDIGLSRDYISLELGITVENKDNSKDLILTYIF